ncbi:DUF2642 domain-containing protein [Vallitalea guaymasensis]|uniref:DUF2642 domain-containing protein n=1 Tax=Vallitalea guaymasensis TaxID=1185412 RepID=A0A8J8MF96_9FIRM|nr:DUF2642 domain-containing protein [Vallitalea guaymasensis]QUH31803.1 DUF2642 domain-containing protein [Vallitalea guaymasensis]
MNNRNEFPMDTVTLVDPYVVQTLQTVIGNRILVDTLRGAIQGTLVDVKPDHIVLKEREDDQPVFVRIQQIVFVMPISE